MRKGTVLFVSLLLLLTGCAPVQEQPPVSPLAGHTGGYTAEMQAVCGDRTIAATLSHQTPDACTVTFTTPDAIQGMAFVFHQDAVDICYRDVVFPVEAQLLPGGTVAKIAVDAIGQAMQGNTALVTDDDGNMSLTGLLNAGEFQLALRDDLPATLSVPQQQLEITFTSFQLLDA